MRYDRGVFLQKWQRAYVGDLATTRITVESEKAMFFASQEVDNGFEIYLSPGNARWFHVQGAVVDEEHDVVMGRFISEDRVEFADDVPDNFLDLLIQGAAVQCHLMGNNGFTNAIYLDAPAEIDRDEVRQRIQAALEKLDEADIAKPVPLMGALPAYW